jgi:hypothetical protein
MSGAVDEADLRVACCADLSAAVFPSEEAISRVDGEIEAELMSSKSTIANLMPMALLSVDLLSVVLGTLSIGRAY